MEKVFTLAGLKDVNFCVYDKDGLRHIITAAGLVATYAEDAIPALMEMYGEDPENCFCMGGVHFMGLYEEGKFVGNPALIK